jgi:hypothetical protein
MSGKAAAVLWLGLILIALNLISQWSTIKSVLFTGSSSSGSSGGSGGFKLPTLPLPFPFNTIPLSAGAQPVSGQTTNIQAV